MGPALAPEGKAHVGAGKIAFGRPINEDEVDLESGYVFAVAAIPVAAPAAKTAASPRFAATRDQVFTAFPANANLTDKAVGARVSIPITATRADGFDAAWLRRAVDVPLDEANLDGLQRE